MPTGVALSEVPPRIAIEDIGHVSFAELLVELGIKAQRSALPGVQDKTSAAMINLPVARAGQRYILKLNPIGEYPHLVENEAFFLAAARTCGLTVCRSDLVTDRNGAPGLLIRRFDRITDEGRLARWLSRTGARQRIVRPLTSTCWARAGSSVSWLRRATRLSSPLVVIRQLAFAYLSGNGDAHAKNFSILQDQLGEWTVSPVYDVPCSYVYGDTTMALSIAGRAGGDFGAEDFVASGLDLGVPERATRRMLADLGETQPRMVGRARPAAVRPPSDCEAATRHRASVHASIHHTDRALVAGRPATCRQPPSPARSRRFADVYARRRSTRFLSGDDRPLPTRCADFPSLCCRTGPSRPTGSDTAGAEPGHDQLVISVDASRQGGAPKGCELDRWSAAGHGWSHAAADQP